MISPAPVDLQITAGKTFPHKPASSRQSEGSTIARLNVGFQTMEFEPLKGAPENEPHSFAHQPLPSVGSKSVIAQKCALQCSADDIVQVDGANKIARLTKENQKPPVRIGSHTFHISFKFIAVVRRGNPPTMQSTTPPDRREKCGSVTKGRWSNGYPCFQ